MPNESCTVADDISFMISVERCRLRFFGGGSKMSAIKNVTVAAIKNKKQA